MKIAIIGTINKDLILPFQESPIESFGGIFYNISILSQLLDPGDRIIPYAFIGEDIEATIHAILKKMSNVMIDGLRVLPQRNHKVILEYTSPEERQEKSLFQFPSLSTEHVAPAGDAEMVMVNLVSGWDITLETFLHLSQQAREKMYLDVHYLLMGVDELGRRFPQKPSNIDQWLRGARFIQMNEQEFQILAADSRNSIDFYQKKFTEDQILLTTLAKEGAVLVYSRGGMVRHKHVPAYHISRFIDTTGCGDAFGAAFVVKYLETGDISLAVDYANLVAGANTVLRGTNEMHRLKEMMDEIQKANKSPSRR